MRHLLTLSDLAPREIDVIFALTTDLKAKWCEGLRESLLPGRVLALLFDNDSLRTRVSFQSAMSQLGGRALALGRDAGFRTREKAADFCRILSQFVDVIVMRTQRHESLVEVAGLCSCSVINGRTNIAHPCHALADLFTAAEALGSVRGQKLAYLGPCDSLARSLADGCARLGMRFVMAAPKSCQLEKTFIALLRHEISGGHLEVTTDPYEAVHDASIVYAGNWNLAEGPARKGDGCCDQTDYRLTPHLLARAPAEALRMHCLRLEPPMAVNGEVFDHRQSLVADQITNRLHVQKGLLLWLLGSHGGDTTAECEVSPAEVCMSARACS